MIPNNELVNKLNALGVGGGGGTLFTPNQHVEQNASGTIPDFGTLAGEDVGVDLSHIPAGVHCACTYSLWCWAIGATGGGQEYFEWQVGVLVFDTSGGDPITRLTQNLEVNYIGDLTGFPTQPLAPLISNVLGAAGNLIFDFDDNVGGNGALSLRYAAAVSEFRQV